MEDRNEPTGTAPWPPPLSQRDEGEAVPATLNLPRLSAAGWLASAGAALLLVASVVVVAGNWHSIGVEVRFSGLVGALVAVHLAAEAARRRSPLTAAALAVLAATLTAPVGVAAAATLHRPWPVCILAGGLASLVALEVQWRRWRIPALQAGTVVSFGLVAVGAAALLSIPVALVGAGGAAVALALRAERRAVVLALAVGASPVAAGLAVLRLGDGTLDRIGVTGTVPVWQGLATAAVSAGVVAIVATRRHNAPLAVASIAVLASGVVTSVVRGDVESWVWWMTPAACLLAVEIVAATGVATVWRDLARRVSGWLPMVVAVPALVVPYRMIVSLGAGLPTSHPDLAWIPLGFTSLALIAAALGSVRRSGDAARLTLVALGASACTVAAVAAAGLPLWVASVVALACWVATSAVTPWRSWDVPTAVIASWVLLAEVVDGGPVALRIALIGAAGVAVVVAIATTRRDDHELRLVGTAAIVAMAAAIASGGAPVEVGVVMLLGLLVVGIGLCPESSTGPLIVASVISANVAMSPAVGWLDVVAMALLACAVALTSRGASSPRSHAAAGLAVVAASFGVALTGMDAETATLVAAMLAIALTGVSLVDRRLGAAQTAGLVAAAIGLGASLSAGAAFTSLAVIVFGAQVALAGRVWRGEEASLPGIALVVAGAVSLWWTTGTNAWAIETIAPYGATGTDVAMAAAVLALLGGGVVMRGRLAVSSWLAYGPGLATATAWLLASQLEPATGWATLGGLAIGTIAIAVGGVRRLAAPLVTGTLLLTGTIVVSAGPRLSAAPTWAWIAGGGAALLAIAAAIERSDRPLLPTGRTADGPQSIAEQFCHQFH